jgi:NadR type nicotinamide-nucleotide adenylyltransferase
MKKIAITGPESTGKSSLAMALANEFRASWVEEYARKFLKNKGAGYSYSFEDISFIAKRQAELEDSIVEADYLFCDTDMLVCKIWQEFVFGYCDPWIENEFQNRDYDLYLLCNVDLPWEYDPLREHPEKRAEIFNLYLTTLNSYNKNYIVISGKGKERLLAAVRAVNLLK